MILSATSCGLYKCNDNSNESMIKGAYGHVIACNDSLVLNLAFCFNFTCLF